MEQNNIAFIGVRLMGLFLVASHLDQIAAWLGFMVMASSSADTMGLPIPTIRAISAASLLPPIAGVILWYRAEQWSRTICSGKTQNKAHQESVDIVRAACFIVGLYLFLSGLPAFIVQLSQYLYVGENFYNAHEPAPYLEPAIRCALGLACLLGSNSLRELFNRFRHFGR